MAPDTTHANWLAAVDRALELWAAPPTPEVSRQACLVIADTVGVAAGGFDEPVVRALVGQFAAMGHLGGGSGTATVLNAGRDRVTPDVAAYLNASAGSFLELDEGIRPTGHPAMHIVPAALAVAEHADAPGERLVRAVLAGYEVTYRLFQAFDLDPELHPHGHFGAVGAALAAALLLDADPVLACTIAATTPILATWEPCFEGATARNTYMGSAASSAVRAAFLARAGFSGSASALSIGLGEIAGRCAHPEALAEPVDPERPAIARNYFKFHSACALTHTALDAALALRAERPQSVQKVVVHTTGRNLRVARQAEPNALSARFSLPYAVATALLRGETSREAFDYDADVADYAARVLVVEDADLTQRWPDEAPARVTLDYGDHTESVEVANPRGHHANPSGPGDLEEKFLRLVTTGEASDLWRRLQDLPGEASCRLLLAPGRRGTSPR